jgi:SAM-dependent methyltransferase
VFRDLLPNAWTLNIQPVKAAEFHHKEQGGSSLNFAGLSNYVQSLGQDGLPGIFAAGRIGLYHDWCYMFPVYPRGFDLIHVRSLTLPHENCLQQAVLELDRLLRPGGYIVLSGSGIAEAVTEEAVAVLRWMKVPALSSLDPDGGHGAAMVMRKMGGLFNSL